jgi:hypothetical protein
MSAEAPHLGRTLDAVRGDDDPRPAEELLPEAD